jgi:hypothetical protein
LERSKVSQTNFRPETVSLTPRQLAGIRSLIHAIGLNCTNGEEQSKLRDAIETAKQLARKAGGDAPLPLPPKAELLVEVERLSGNEQLMAAFERHRDIIDEVERWKGLAEKVFVRQARWGELKSALKYCQNLVGFDELMDEVHAIEQNRSLLVDPDPVQPLLKQVIEKIRVAILKKYEDFQTEYNECLKDVQEDAIWNQLSNEQQEQLLKKHHLDNLEMSPLSGNDRVLECIENTSLAQWSDKTSALAGRFSRMRQDAVDLLVPKAQIVHLPRSVIETEAELDIWLAKVRQDVMAALAENRPASLK